MSDHSLVSPELTVETKTSLYDKMNGLLLAALIMVGSIVFFLALIWLTSIIKFKTVAKEPFFEEQPAGEEAPEGVADDVLEPGVEEFPEVDTPQLADALEAVTSALSSVRANLEFRDGDAAQMGKGRGLGTIGGGGEGGNGDVLPEYKRWKIEFEARDIDKYATQLSFFKIDLGAVDKTDPTIHRMTDPGGVARISKTDRSQEKKTIYFAHERPQLQRWEETMFKRKGVEMGNSFTVQFYPEETRSKLRQIEGQYLQQFKRQLREVQNTIFKVVPNGSGFDFKVIKQTYRARR